MNGHNVKEPRTFIVMPVEDLPGLLLIALEKDNSVPTPRYFENPVDMGIHIAATVMANKS